MRRAVLVLGSALALTAASCGPYANVAQKLDVTARVVGDTWIAKGGADEIRVLLVGTPSPEGLAPFSFSSVYERIAAGNSVYTLQGTWAEVGSAGDTTLHVEHEYSYPDESTKNILARTGTTRSDDRFEIPLTVARSGDQLVVSGDPRLAGTYVPLTHGLAGLGTATEADAACAFHVANLAMLRSQGRIIGFGGPGITQYQEAEDYIGTVAGSLRISASLSGGFPPDHSKVTIRYSAFEDIGGVIVDGPMITDADSGGTGLMSGVVTFTFKPVAGDGTPGTPMSGTMDYGANAIVITGGNPSGGYYTVAIGGGGAALVSPIQPPTPSLADCLALP